METKPTRCFLLSRQPDGEGKQDLFQNSSSLKSQVHSGTGHVFFAQLLSENKGQRTPESTIQTVSEEDKTGPVLMSENNGKELPVNNAQCFKPVFLSLGLLSRLHFVLLQGPRAWAAFPPSSCHFIS